jgi:transmembrane sensor
VRRTLKSGVENEADSAAVEWIARIDRHGGDERHHAALKAWLDADPRHRGAYERARAGWSLLDEALAHGGTAEPTTRGGRPAVSRRAMIGGLSATAAGVAGVAFLGAPTRTHAYSTRIGEIRRVALAHGFSVTLDTDSRMEARTESSRREVRMIRGCALFEVAPGKAGFVATTGDLRAQGSEGVFSLRASPSPEVIVARGELQLSNRSAAGRWRQTLDAGQRATLAPGGVVRIAAISEDAIERSLAWRQGGISLDGETVGVAAQMLNRYNRRPIVVSDPAIANQHIVGWFAIDQPATFAKAVAAAFQGDVVERENAIQILPGEKN